MKENDVRAKDRELVPGMACGQTTCFRRSKYHGMDELPGSQRLRNEGNRQLKRLAADNYLGIPNLTANTERELGNPILHTRFQAILGAIGQEIQEVDGDQVSRRVK